MRPCLRLLDESYRVARAALVLPFPDPLALRTGRHRPQGARVRTLRHAWPDDHHLDGVRPRRAPGAPSSADADRTGRIID